MLLFVLQVVLTNMKAKLHIKKEITLSFSLYKNFLSYLWL